MRSFRLSLFRPMPQALALIVSPVSMIRKAVLFLRVGLFVALLVPVGALSPAVARQPLGGTFDVVSDHLGEARTIRYALPDAYHASSERYPVLIVLDAEVAFPHTVSAARFLETLGLVPPLIVVGVPNTQRNRDMPVPAMYENGGQDDFLAFLSVELVTDLHQRFKTQPRIILTGHSQGGLFAHYALATVPEVFDWIVALDTPLMPPADVVQEKVLASFMTGRLVSVERSLGWRSDFSDLEAVSEDHPDTFVAQVFVDRDAESHQSMTYVGTYLGLKALFRDYRLTGFDAKNLRELQTIYASLSARYGYEIPIPDALVRRNIDDLIFQVRLDEARALVDYLASSGGSASVVEAFRRRIAEAEALGPLDETVDDLLALAPVPAGEAAAFLGTWSGRLYAADGHGVPVSMELHLEDRGGFVEGETILTYPDGIPRVLDNVMIRLMSDGRLEWGYMNQMRPRGVLVTSVRLVEDDRLEGSQEMKGVRMTFPPGFVPSDWIVELERVDTELP